MLLLEVPREAAIGPPCPDLSMSSLTKLNFTDYSNKLNKTYDNTQQDKLNYEQALARLNYENNTVSTTKVQYGEQNRLAFDPNVDPSLCQDPAYALATGTCFGFGNLENVQFRSGNYCFFKTVAKL